MASNEKRPAMELPNYFLADSPMEEALTPALITDACHTLKRNGKRYLVPRPTESVIHVLASVAKDWLEAEFPFRKRVLEEGPKEMGFSPETLGRGMDGLFRQITKENLEALVVQEIGSLRRLDEMVPEEGPEERASLVRGPELLVQITGGVLPNPTITSMILGMLAKSAQFFKCASGTAFLPRMFAHSIYMVEPKLGACLELAEWKGGNQGLEQALLAEAGCVTATGSDETLSAIRRQVPAAVRFLGYGHRLSFAFIAQEMLAKINLRKVASAVAEDVVAWNQLGCLSPHVVYVESGGAIGAHDFAAQLAQELKEREEHEPRGPLEAEEAGAISTRRMFYQVRASHDEGTRIWMSEESTDWTVIFEEDPQFQSSCLNRFVYVKAVAGLDQLLEAVAPITGKVSTVGISAPINRGQEIATRFARWGVTRVCPVGTMQEPPLRWRHDGRPSLGDLVTWTDWELSS